MKRIDRGEPDPENEKGGEMNEKIVLKEGIKYERIKLPSKSTFTIPGKPVPKVRMTRYSKWTDRAKAILSYQEYVAWCANAAKIPTYTGDVILTVKICLGSRGRADLSNLIKAIEDGLEYGGVVVNDKQIIGYGAGTGFSLGWKEPQVMVTIEEAK